MGIETINIEGSEIPIRDFNVTVLVEHTRVRVFGEFTVDGAYDCGKILCGVLFGALKLGEILIEKGWSDQDGRAIVDLKKRNQGHQKDGVYKVDFTIGP